MVLRASSSAAPARVPPRDLGSPDLVRGDPRVVSTASIRRSSTLDKVWMLRSASRVLVVTEVFGVHQPSAGDAGRFHVMQCNGIRCYNLVMQCGCLLGLQSCAR